MIQTFFRAGYIALIGRPNVGKSTLLNRLVGQKVSIISDKPQTTRHRILGIKTEENFQAVYIDTPGLHQKKGRFLNKIMNRAALETLEYADVIGLVIEGMQWTAQETWILNTLEKMKKPIVLIINQVDLIHPKDQLLPFIEKMGATFPFASIVPVSAKTGDNVEALEKVMADLLPENTKIYLEDEVTDRNERFLSAEFIREKIMQRLHEEVPYSATVTIEKFEEKENITVISALIWVEREGQKAILIGKQGKQLKDIGQAARKDIETLLGKKVFLELWVRVKENWADNERWLKGAGYGE